MSDDMRSLGDILRRPGAQRPAADKPRDDVAPPPPDDPDTPHPTVEHDPTGLDLASRIAEAAAASGAALPPPTKKRRRRQTEGPKRARRDDPTPLGDAVANLISQRGWTRAVNLKALLADWPALVGQANADHSKPEAYVDKVLTIRADSTAWATSLRLFAPQLVAKLNEALGDGTVTRVEVLAPTAPSWRHGMRVVRDGRGPRDTYG